MKKTDSAVHISSLKKSVQDFCEARDWDQFHNAKDLAIGLITEASELLEHFRFLSPEECDRLLEKKHARDEIEDELADVLFFILRFAQRYQIDLSSAVSKKMRKNEDRYPVETAKGSNKKYTEFKK